MENNDWNEDNWAPLIHTIRRGNCILMLGPEVATEVVEEKTISFSTSLANTLYENLGELDIDANDLSQTAQYYARQVDRSALEVKVVNFYESRRSQTSELHQNLASLPFQLILSTTPDQLMVNALQEQNRHPKVGFYHFDCFEKNPTIIEEGTQENPLVYYLYGGLKEPDSLVLTEEDLLKFLMALIQNQPSLPQNLLSALRDKNKSLLFLGFGFRHWYQRILLYALQGEEKRSRSFALEPLYETCPHCDNFNQTVLFYRDSTYKIQIYRHNAQQFVAELKERFVESGGAQLAAEPLPDGPTLFICHANEDKPRALSLFEQLKTEGFRPWIDREGLESGDFWDPKILQTIKKADYFLLLQSSALHKKTVGYVNKEIEVALDQKQLFRSPLRYLIPMTIGGVENLEVVEEIQAINLDSTEGFPRLVKTIKRDWARRQQR